MLPGIEALPARFVKHAYRPHSHPTWTIAVVERGAVRFEVERSRQRAGAGELFVLEPEAVHTGMAAVPESWVYKVLYVEPQVLCDWAERDGPPPRAARWVVFRDPALRSALLAAHDGLAHDPRGLGVQEGVLAAVAELAPPARPRPAQGPRAGRARAGAPGVQAPGRREPGSLRSRLSSAEDRKIVQDASAGSAPALPA